MPRIVLRTAGTPTYSGGAFGDSNGVHMPQVSPLFTDWDSAGSSPPSGIGSSYSCGWQRAFVDDSDYLYAIVQESAGSGKGVYKYLLNTSVDPITMSYVGMTPLSGMGLGATFSDWLYDFDRENGTILISAWTNVTGLNETMGRWSIGNWPFTSANAMWRGVPSSYGSLVSGKLGYYPVCGALDKANNRLIVAGAVGTKACVFNYATGAFLGEQVWDSTWSANYTANIIGLDDNGYVLAGGWLAAIHSGNVHAYDISNPASWSDQGKVYDKGGTAWNYARKNIYRRPLANWGYNIFSMPVNILAGQQEDIGIIDPSDGWCAYLFDQPYIGYGYSSPILTTHDFVTDTYEQHLITRGSTSSRSGFGGYGNEMCNITLINGSPWMVYATEGSKDHLEGNALGARVANGIAAMPAGIATAVYPFTVSGEQKPYILTHGVQRGQRNSEHSDHPGKHEFRLSINDGSTYTGWRCGEGLAALDEAWNGDPAWPNLPVGVTCKIEHRMTSGILYNFCSVSGNPNEDTDPQNLGDIGPPRNIEPELFTEYAEVGGGLL